MGMTYVAPVNLASPGPIGGTTPAAGTFTNITANTRFTAGANGSATAVMLGNSATNGIFFGTNTIDFATSGTAKWQISSGGTLSSPGYTSNVEASTFRGSSGTVTVPTFTFGSSGDTNTGFYRVSEGNIGATTDGVLRLTIGTAMITSTLPITVPGTTNPLITTSAAITTGAGAGLGTLTDAPSAGNPTKWIPINDNGTTRYIPAW